eukprot:GHVU01138372.1.p1 GENE.GHVU01138372.1~~GHVU01138372.1.p1  ORF type:complete len:308 (+),score=31.15 GHVU01138372.1:2075-2998(+)
MPASPVNGKAENNQAIEYIGRGDIPTRPAAMKSGLELRSTDRTAPVIDLAFCRLSSGGARKAVSEPNFHSHRGKRSRTIHVGDTVRPATQKVDRTNADNKDKMDCERLAHAQQESPTSGLIRRHCDGSPEDDSAAATWRQSIAGSQPTDHSSHRQKRGRHVCAENQPEIVGSICSRKRVHTETTEQAEVMEYSDKTNKMSTDGCGRSLQGSANHIGAPLEPGIAADVLPQSSLCKAANAVDGADEVRHPSLSQEGVLHSSSSRGVSRSSRSSRRGKKGRLVGNSLLSKDRAQDVRTARHHMRLTKKK